MCPAVVRIFETRSFSRVSKAFFGLIWPVKPKYGLNSCKEYLRHSSIEIVSLVPKLYHWCPDCIMLLCL